MRERRPRSNKSPRRKPGDREPQGADPVACAQGFYGGREHGHVENLPPRALRLRAVHAAWFWAVGLRRAER